MKFSLWTSNARPWSEIEGLALATEAAGWHGFWYPDHFMSQTPDDAPGEGPALDCWTVLTAIAMRVPRLRLTSMVSPLTIHHPVVLAKRVATLDQISGGRVVCGVGAGWQVNEHEGYGIELREPGDRVSHFVEALQVIRRLFDDERADFAGRWYSLTNAPFEPKPVQQPLPILVGTSSPRMMRATAQYAQEWNCWGDPALVATHTANFVRACEAVGRDPATVRRSAQAMVSFVAGEASRASVIERAPVGRSIIGSSEQLVDVIGQYEAAGVDEFALPDFNLGRTATERAEAIERFRVEVAAPLLRSA